MVAGARALIGALDEQPVVSFALLAVAAQADQHPSAFQPLAVHDELEMAFGDLLLRRAVADRLPSAAIPQQHRGAAVLALGDGPLEVAVVEGMILDLDREALVVRVARRSLGHRPRLENTVEL